MRSRYARPLLLFGLCAVPAGIEAGLLLALNVAPNLGSSPQASAMWPYATLHDLR